ncbi:MULTISPECIES: beta-galactosidase [Nocardiopsis]|uniref:Beta-galactosidase n=1 Tax=Nocardiopsis sinuspersici TaxID=501010 RepID=A0A1V3C531_9ACTN|nr:MULTISPECIES: beta-galactosidase [Nocardiopsis]OOC55835.1 beta-galactosidase [Nocardiopsis sinuspersici]
MPSPLWFGGDYNPEQWPEDVQAEDVELMRRAGVNLVTVGVFSWSLLEPGEGEYRFGWLDRVMDRLDENGVGVALATPTASPPPWFGLAHPDAMPVTADGTRLTHGSRDTYDVCAPAYREASVRVARALAERYASHPALRMWHVHNEYGTWSHSEHTARAFRDWLRGRHGDLDRLNAAWTTAFWSQHYSEWEQVQPPRATQYLPNPAHVLDFRRFLSDAMLDHFLSQRDVLRAVRPDTPVTTNLAFGDWVPVDPWRWAEHVDLVAVDDYPDRTGAGGAEQTAFSADLARSWAERVPGPGRPWVLMEQAAGVTYTGEVTRPKAPGETVRHSLAHVARGSRGAMFFQWRASRGGAEQWHSGMVPHAGPDSRIFREVCELGSLLPRVAEVRDADVVADAALTWDPECWWALGSPSLPSRGVDYLESVRQAHRVLWRSGRTVDMVRPDRDLPRVPLLVVPALYLLSDGAAERLARYTEDGGTLVVTFLSGVADPDGTVRTGGYPGALRDLLGVRVEEVYPLPSGESVGMDLGSVREEVTLWSEHVHLAGAEAVAHYAGGPLDGLPAATRRRHGAGEAWYLSARLTDRGLARLLAEAAGTGPFPEPGLDVVRRVDRDGAWVFVTNHDNRPRRIDPARFGLDSGARDLVSGASAEGMALPGGGVAVLRGHPVDN